MTIFYVVGFNFRKELNCIEKYTSQQLIMSHTTTNMTEHKHRISIQRLKFISDMLKTENENLILYFLEIDINFIPKLMVPFHTAGHIFLIYSIMLQVATLVIFIPQISPKTYADIHWYCMSNYNFVGQFALMFAKITIPEMN